MRCNECKVKSGQTIEAWTIRGEAATCAACELPALRTKLAEAEAKLAALEARKYSPPAPETERNTHRGHKIYKDKTGEYRYCDTDELTSETWASRPCGFCGKWGSSNEGRPDPCLGQLPGVTNACCGHGDRDQSYVCFKGGVVLCGFFVATEAVQDTGQAEESPDDRA